MSFRDKWMKVGKASKTTTAGDAPIPPLHLVLIELRRTACPGTAGFINQARCERQARQVEGFESLKNSACR
jgi:hypothetical protein